MADVKAFARTDRVTMQEARSLKRPDGGASDRASWRTRSMTTDAAEGENPFGDDPWRDEDLLRDLYHSEGKTQYEIAELFDCAQCTVGCWMDKFGIETRSVAENHDNPWHDEETLRRLYYGQELTVRRIATRFDAGESTILYWMDKFGIERRDRPKKEGQYKDKNWLETQLNEEGKSYSKIAEECGVTFAAVSYWAEEFGISREYDGYGIRKDAPINDPEWLAEEYEEKSMQQIADGQNVSRSVVETRLKRFDIPTKDRSEYCGEDHWLYEGGRQGYGPGWNKEKRRRVRERDQFKCRHPGCAVTQDEHLEDEGRKLPVHHIQKARHFESPEERNAMDNLITLCRTHHRVWERMSPLKPANVEVGEIV